MEVSISFDKDVLAQYQKNLKNRLKTASAVLQVECKKHADSYTPMQDGNLRQNFQVLKDDEGFTIGWEYTEPYARRQWFGLTEEGKTFNYSKDKNPNARNRWTEHAAVNHKDLIVKVLRLNLKDLL